MPAEPVRIAMWSGPRTISTALLRSWGNRGDTAVVDEPLYAHYLRVSGADHPGRAAVLASQPDDWRAVVDRLLGPVPGGKPLWYQKHMAHHLTADVDTGWTAVLRNCFLLRHPAELLASYTKVRADVTLADTGLCQQLALFDEIRARDGVAPPVIEAADVLRDPRAQLGALCAAVGVGFDEAMLSWSPGGRATDGIWAPYWYAAVERSTGFAPYRQTSRELPARLHRLLDECMDRYQAMLAHRLSP